MGPAQVYNWPVDFATAIAQHLGALGVQAGLAEVAGRHFRPRRCATHDVLVREGDDSRDFFLVLEGQVRVERSGLDLGHLDAGAHFGEIALIAGRPRAASVIAASPGWLGHLEREAFEAMAESHPHVALGLVEALLGTLGAQLTEMSERVGLLLRERSLPRRVSVQISSGGRALEVPTGTVVGSILPPALGPQAAVAGLVDRKAVSLNALVSAGCDIVPLYRDHWEGERVFQQSLGLLLLEAAEEVLPGCRLRVERSLGFAQRITTVPSAPSANGGRSPPPLDFPAAPADHDLAAAASAIERALVDWAARDVDLREELWTLEEARALFLERGWDDAAALLRTHRDATVAMVSYGTVYAPRLGAYAANTGLLRGGRVFADNGGLLLVPPPRAVRHSHVGADGGRGETGLEATMGTSTPLIAGGIDASAEEARSVARHVRRITADQSRWLDAVGVKSVGAFNAACIDGRVGDLIRVTEGFHEKRIGQIADAIAARRDTLRIVCIAGPSSSGKTTFIKRLSTQLKVNGVTPHAISLDDYYVDRDRTPRDEEGDLDFEALDALDLRQLSSDLGALLRGDAVRTARYDFLRGKSLPAERAPLTLGDGHVLMLEGIHGLNPALLSGVEDGQVFRVFICPMSALPFDRLHPFHVSDLRLLRRIVRDRHNRGFDAARNIALWPKVRRGERRHIFPFQGCADAVFDSSLLYEVSVLRVFAERYLFEVDQRDPAYTTAFRLLSLLDYFIAIYPDHVPPTSLLREFIGGSGFEY